MNYGYGFFLAALKASEHMAAERLQAMAAAVRAAVYADPAAFAKIVKDP